MSSSHSLRSLWKSQSCFIPLFSPSYNFLFPKPPPNLTQPIMPWEWRRKPEPKPRNQQQVKRIKIISRSLETYMPMKLWYKTFAKLPIPDRLSCLCVNKQVASIASSTNIRQKKLYLREKGATENDKDVCRHVNHAFGRLDILPTPRYLSKRITLKLGNWFSFVEVLKIDDIHATHYLFSVKSALYIFQRLVCFTGAFHSTDCKVCPVRRYIFPANKGGQRQKAAEKQKKKGIIKKGAPRYVWMMRPSRK